MYTQYVNILKMTNLIMYMFNWSLTWYDGSFVDDISLSY